MISLGRISHDNSIYSQISMISSSHTQCIKITKLACCWRPEVSLSGYLGGFLLFVADQDIPGFWVGNHYVYMNCISASFHSTNSMKLCFLVVHSKALPHGLVSLKPSYNRVGDFQSSSSCLGLGSKIHPLRDPKDATLNKLSDIVSPWDHANFSRRPCEKTEIFFRNLALPSYHNQPT